MGVNETMTMEFRDLILAYRSLTMQEIKVDILLPCSRSNFEKGSITFATSQLGILFKSLICLEVVNKPQRKSQFNGFLLPRMQQK